MKVSLFYRTTCPYCQKVLSFMKQNNIQIPIDDISDNKNLENLIKIGGKKQVPCLLIDGKAMYESDDIIKWLSANAVRS